MVILYMYVGDNCRHRMFCADVSGITGCDTPLSSRHSHGLGWSLFICCGRDEGQAGHHPLVDQLAAAVDVEMADARLAPQPLGGLA